MKKLKFILPLLAIGVLFVGCGKKEKDEYIETYQKLSNITEFNEQEIKVKIDDFQLDMDEDENEGQASMYMNMITSQLKDMDISGKVTINSKEQLMKMNLDMKGFGSTMNFSGFIDDKALYLSGTYLADLFNLSKDLTGTEMMDEETTDELKNKYILLPLDELAKSTGEKTIDTKDFGELFLKSQQNPLYTDFLKTLPDDKFTKKDEQISNVMNKKEFVEFLKFSAEKSDKEEKEYLKSLETKLKSIETLNVKSTLDKKKNTQKLHIHLVASDSGNTLELKAQLVSKFTKTEEKISLPSKEQIISIEEIQNMMAAATEKAQKSMQMIPDETFDELYDAVNAQKEQINRAKLDEALADVMPLLTDEQKQKLEEILPNE